MIKQAFTDTTTDPEGPLRIDHIETLWVDDDNSSAQSTLGEYSNVPRTGAIDCSTRPGFDPHQYRYWNPANPDLEHPDYIEQDFARHEALCRGEWSYQGCVVRAVVSYPIGNGSRRLEILSSAGLYGIESDSSPLYLLEVELEQLIDLRDHVQHFDVPWGPDQDLLLDQVGRRITQLQEETKLTGEGTGQAVDVHAGQVGGEGGG